ncbi:hypothetical protein QJQ45_011569 [Haematococcus lacustris]|nr:hypothetical protein QJQ45_011569 [Haematococcus lacustris]
MPPVPKHTRASRANGAKTQAGHEAAKSMEQLTAAHAALTAAHAAVTAELLNSKQMYSQLRERHLSLMVFVNQPAALEAAHKDLADFEARLLTLRKQKRDKEATSADDNREAKAARKTEESACMVDGNAKMVLNVPTQAPLQQLQQAFQQHARGADYSNTSAKEATRFTREQLRAYLLYHKVPPRDQPVGNTLVAGWQKAVLKHIAERGSPTGHGAVANQSTPAQAKDYRQVAASIVLENEVEGRHQVASSDSQGSGADSLTVERAAPGRVRQVAVLQLLRIEEGAFAGLVSGWATELSLTEEWEEEEQPADQQQGGQAAKQAGRQRRGKGQGRGQGKTGSSGFSGSLRQGHIRSELMHQSASLTQRSVPSPDCPA